MCLVKHRISMTKNTNKYIKLWWRLTIAASQIALTSRFSAVLFILGKVLRYISFFVLLSLVTLKTRTIAGYTFWQMLFFFLTFNTIDTAAQLLLRDVYRFRGHIVSGYFDYILTKPLSALFKSLFGGSDILDIPLLLISIAATIYVIPHIGVITTVNVVLYVLLITNGFLLALALHIFVLCVGILTTEVDNAIMLYRDLTQMGRVPIDIYKEPLKGILTFIIPVGIMMTFPAKSLLGVLSWGNVFISVIVSVTLLYISLLFWKFALRNYSSASS